LQWPPRNSISDRTEVRAPVDGYVTNLGCSVGDYANTGVPRLALIDSHSYWIYGYFEETKLTQCAHWRSGRHPLMSGARNCRALSRASHAASPTRTIPPVDLLANVNPTFNWVRAGAATAGAALRINGGTYRKGRCLAAGMTATLIVRPRSRAIQRKPG